MNRIEMFLEMYPKIEAIAAVVVLLILCTNPFALVYLERMYRNRLKMPKIEA